MAKMQQRKTKKQRSFQQENKEQEFAGPERDGLSHPAVAVAYGAASTNAPVVQNKQNPSQLVEEGKKQQTTSPYQYHVPAQFAAVPPVQRKEEADTAQFSLFGAMTPDFMMTDEEKKAKKEKEAHGQLQKYLYENIPDCLSAFGVAKWKASFQVDENDFKAYDENRKYHEKEAQIINLWIAKKDDLNPEVKKMLQRELGRVIEKMTTPLSLKSTYKNLFINNGLDELALEVVKIKKWMGVNSSNPEVDRLNNIGLEIMRFLQIAKKAPLQKAKDLKFDRWYYIASDSLALADLAFFVFGDSAKTQAFKQYDGSPISDAICTGQPIFFEANESPVTKMFSASLSGKGKSTIKTNGEIAEPMSSGLMEFTIGGQHYSIQSHFYQSFAKNKYETLQKLLEIEKTDGIKSTIDLYHQHKSETNGAVRFISNGLGGADFDLSQANKFIREISAKQEEFNDLSQEQLTVEKLDDMARARNLAESYDKIVRDDFQNYINDGVSGAERAKTGLEYAKGAGQIAANFIPGVGFASGLVFDSVSQASEIANGVSDGWDYKRTATQGALSLVNKAGSGLVDKIPGFSKLAGAGIAGKIGKEVLENAIMSPFETLTQSMIMEGKVPSIDSVIDGIADSFSPKNIAIAAIGVGVQTRGNNTGAGFGNGTKSTAMGSVTFSGNGSLGNSRVVKAVSGAGETVIGGFANSKVGDKLIGGLETIDKVLTTDVKDLFKGSKDQKSDSDQNDHQQQIPPGAESSDKKEAPAPDDFGDQREAPVSDDLGESTVADGRRGTDIKAESPNGPKDKSTGPGVKLSVEQIIDNHAEVLSDNPDIADRLAKLVNAPEGKLKQELLQRILSDIEKKSVIVLDDLPPDTTIFDPKFKPNCSAKEMLEHVNFMRAEYNREVLFNPTVEVGLVRNSKTGQLLLIKGDKGSVNNANGSSLIDMVSEFTTNGDHWKLISHSHPAYEVGANQALQYQPSGGWEDGAYVGDLAVMVHDSTSLGGKPVSSKIAVVTPDGIKTSEYGYDPKATEPFWTKIEDPVTGQVETKRYKSIEEYSDFIDNNFDAKGNKKDQVDGKVDNAQTQVDMAPIEDNSNEQTQVGGKPIAAGDLDKTQLDQPALDGWEDITQVDLDQNATQIDMAPIEDNSNEQTQVDGNPIAAGDLDKTQLDQPALDGWEDITQVDLDQNATQIDMAPIEDNSNEQTQVGGKPIAAGTSDKALQDQAAVDNKKRKKKTKTTLGTTRERGLHRDTSGRIVDSMHPDAKVDSNDQGIDKQLDRDVEHSFDLTFGMHEDQSIVSLTKADLESPEKLDLLQATAQDYIVHARAMAIRQLHDLGIPLSGDTVIAIPKREGAAELGKGVKEKVERKEYKLPVQMPDIVRGRVNLDSYEEVLQFVDNLDKLTEYSIVEIVTPRRQNDEGFGYPRFHVIIQNKKNGMLFEWQIGTGAVSQVYEKKGIKLPSKIEAYRLGNGDHSKVKFKNDLHDIEYDIFQQMLESEDLRIQQIAKSLNLKGFTDKVDLLAAESGRIGSKTPNLEAKIDELHIEASSLLAALEEQGHIDLIIEMLQKKHGH